MDKISGVVYHVCMKRNQPNPITRVEMVLRSGGTYGTRWSLDIYREDSGYGFDSHYLVPAKAKKLIANLTSRFDLVKLSPRLYRWDRKWEKP
jgi:hypothetical protein